MGLEVPELQVIHSSPSYLDPPIKHTFKKIFLHIFLHLQIYSTIFTLQNDLLDMKYNWRRLCIKFYLSTRFSRVSWWTPVSWRALDAYITMDTLDALSTGRSWFTWLTLKEIRNVNVWRTKTINAIIQLLYYIALISSHFVFIKLKLKFNFKLESESLSQLNLFN